MLVFCDICKINLIKKYLFASLVVVYVITAVGIPVYFHYCGGELEKINYVLKSDGCCGDDEDSADANDCCKDENYVLKSNADFTFQKFGDHSFVTAVSDLIFTHVFYFPSTTVNTISSNHLAYLEAGPPRNQNELIIQTTVIRI